MLDVGDQFPEFTLPGVVDGEIESFSLDELTDDSALLLNVYVYDFEPVCRDQICSVDDMEWLTLTDGLNVAGLNGDGPYAHEQFAVENNITYPLLADTAHSLLSEMGILYDEIHGIEEVPMRSVFLVDQTGTVRYRWIAEDNTEPWTSLPLNDVRDIFDDMESVES